MGSWRPQDDPPRKRVNRATATSRGAVTIGYIAEHLTMLGVQCDRCGRKGRYRTDKLLQEYGPESTLQPFQEKLTADCPHKNDPGYPFGKCAPLFPDLRTLPINQPR
jgi:hypothetical protein